MMNGGSTASSSSQASAATPSAKTPPPNSTVTAPPVAIVTGPPVKTPPPPTSNATVPAAGLVPPAKTPTASSTVTGPPVPAMSVMKAPVPENANADDLTTEGGKPLDLKEFILRHINYDKKDSKRAVTYSLNELFELIEKARDLLKGGSALATISPPCVVVGDIHGQFPDLIRMFSSFTNGKIHGALRKKFAFLGDYVDRGPRSLECISLLLALKLQYPKQFVLLRGNHECMPINHHYGFAEEIADRFGEAPADAEELFNRFNDVFNYLPFAVLIGKKILGMHGGISPLLKSLDDIRNIKLPVDDPHQCQLALDLLWADPVQGLRGYVPNELRGVSVSFGEDMVAETCKRLKVDLIARGHQMMMPGYGFFSNRRLVTIFTAPRYQGAQNNIGAVMNVPKTGKITFKLMYAAEKEHGYSEFAKNFDDLAKNPGFTLAPSNSISALSLQDNTGEKK